jgi:tetratricopeptide (TPR) repeat protein
MDRSAYLIQNEQKVKSLISEKRYEDAYNLCINILKEYPDDGVFIKLINHIRDLSEEETENLVHQKLEEIRQLKKEERYSEALTKLKNLKQISPVNRTLDKEHYKIQKLYLKQLNKKRKKFKKDQIKRFEKILEEKPQDLLSELVLVEKNNPGNQDVQELGTMFREKLINKKINEKKDLLESNKFDAITNFLIELGKINKKSPLIINLEKKIEKRKHQEIATQQNEFVYEGIKHLDTLMKLKKFDKAIQVSKEILSVHNKNKTVQRILKKAERKLFKQSKNLSIENIQKNLEKLKEDYKSNKENFIKI